MPYDVHFVSEQENPVGFWLWRIATAIQDAEEAAEEVSNLRTDVEGSALHRLVDHIPVVSGEVRRDDRNLDALAGSEGTREAALPQQLTAAQQLAAGHDPHDAATVAALQQIYAQVAGQRDGAQSEADSAVDEVERHPF